jgi:hypothetical protein
MKKNTQILFVGGSIMFLIILVAVNILLMRSQKEPYHETMPAIQKKEPQEVITKEKPQSALDIEQEAPIKEKELNN